MASGPSRQCPDCAVPLERIKLLDRNYRSIEDGLFFTTPSAKRRFLDGNYTEAQEIQGFICPQCGRLLLYGETPQTRLPIPSESAEPETSALPRPSSADG
jgi:hypothetical protein